MMTGEMSGPRRPPVTPRMGERRDKDLSLEEAKARLRLEEAEADAARCEACAAERAASGDATALCAPHLRRVYGV